MKRPHQTSGQGERDPCRGLRLCWLAEGMNACALLSMQRLAPGELAAAEQRKQLLRCQPAPCHLAVEASVRCPDEHQPVKG